MRKWYVPLTVLGLGGLGALFFTTRGRQALRWFADNFDLAPNKLLEWNETAQRELDRIQNTLNQLAETLQTTP